MISALGLLALSGDSGSDQAARWVTHEDHGDWVIDTGWYRLRLAKQHGYAGVELRVHAGTGERLDQFWTPDLTFHPMCRMFDNVSFMDTGGGEIQGYVTMDNPFVEAHPGTEEGPPSLVLRGHLQRRSDHGRGDIYFEKTMVFHQRHYDVSLLLRTPEGGAYRYADVWFDINDDWCNRYSNSAGDIINLRPGIEDSEDAWRSHRTISELDNGYGVWVAVSGPAEEILVAVTNPGEVRSLPHAGYTFYDGPTETGDDDAHQSHECIALGVIGGLQHEHVPLTPSELTLCYTVHFRVAQDFDTLYGKE